MMYQMQIIKQVKGGGSCPGRWRGTFIGQAHAGLRLRGETPWCGAVGVRRPWGFLARTRTCGDGWPNPGRDPATGGLVRTARRAWSWCLRPQVGGRARADGGQVEGHAHTVMLDASAAYSQPASTSLCRAAEEDDEDERRPPTSTEVCFPAVTAAPPPGGDLRPGAGLNGARNVRGGLENHRAALWRKHLRRVACRQRRRTGEQAVGIACRPQPSGHLERWTIMRCRGVVEPLKQTAGSAELQALPGSSIGRNVPPAAVRTQAPSSVTDLLRWKPGASGRWAMDAARAASEHHAGGHRRR